MTISKRGFGTNRALAKKVGAIGGSKSKGRTLTPQHKAKLAAAAKRNYAQRQSKTV